MGSLGGGLMARFSGIHEILRSGRRTMIKVGSLRDFRNGFGVTEELHSSALSLVQSRTFENSRPTVALRTLRSSRRDAYSVRATAVATVQANKRESQEAAAEERSANESGGSGRAGVWKAAIDFKWIKENQELVRANVQIRNAAADVDRVVMVYDAWAEMKQKVDALRAQRNVVAAEMKGKLQPERRAQLVEEGKRLKEEVAAMELSLTTLEEELQQEAQKLPNMTHPDVPRGSEDLARVMEIVGEPRSFAFSPVRDHVDVGLELGLFDFDSAAEVTGAKFYYLRDAAVLLEQALVNWTLAKLAARGFTLLATPDLVRASVVEKCGFQPRGSNTQIYSIQESDLCLAGTAEVLVGGMFMDKIMAEAELPIRVAAISHCFRTEAGAAGREGRGLYRVHQFSKVEMFALCTPSASNALHEELISIETQLYKDLGLHFKVLDMASEDLGAPAYRKFDVEAWMPGLKRYGEISSASNCTDYQARRLNIRYRPSSTSSSSSSSSSTLDGDTKGEGALPTPQGKKAKVVLAPPQFVHTLNATACAVPRMIIAILENFQLEDGSVVVPEPLRPYMGGMEVIVKKVN